MMSIRWAREALISDCSSVFSEVYMERLYQYVMDNIDCEMIKLVVLTNPNTCNEHSISEDGIAYSEIIIDIALSKIIRESEQYANSDEIVDMVYRTASELYLQNVTIH